MADRLQVLSAGGSGGGTNASARQPAADEDAATASRSSQAAAHGEHAPETPGPGPEAPPLLLADDVIFIGQDTPAVICL